MLSLTQTVSCFVSTQWRANVLTLETLNGYDPDLHYYHDILAKTLKSPLQKNGMSYPWILIVSLYCLCGM